MDSDRRYSQKEIADIFKKASEEQERIKERSALEDGLTLEDLHLIAKEAGISPDLITDAAARLEHTVEAPPEKRFLGYTTSVHRIVDLKAPLSDDDWDKLVVEIRQAFGARGKVTREGKLREWSNGNLHILVEPTPHGHRLRMGTEKGSARGFVIGSITLILVGIVIFISALLSSGVDYSVFFPAAIFTLAGLAGVGFTGLQLSQWRYDRADQMDAIGSIALNLVSKGGLRAAGALHEQIATNHEKDALETAGLDTEYFDREVEPEHVSRRAKLDLDDAHEGPDQETGPAKRTRA